MIKERLKKRKKIPLSEEHWSGHKSGERKSENRVVECENMERTSQKTVDKMNMSGKLEMF
jgi:hypothetical protein